MTLPEILLQDQDGTDSERAILEGLKAYNVSQAGQSGLKPLILSARDPDGKLLGGLVAQTAWGWLFTKFFWVDDSQRGTGLGKRLLTQAHDEARSRGCHSAYLDTYSFQARPFYEKMGYELFGELTDFPPGHQHYFLKKKL